MRTKELPPGQSFGWGHAEHLGNGYLAPYSVERNDLTFLYVPPVASQKPVEGWTIPSFAYEIHGYTVYPPGNVIAVAEQVEKWVTGVTSLSNGRSPVTDYPQLCSHTPSQPSGWLPLSSAPF